MEISYNRTLEVKYDVDVFIAGGGPAGVAAAVSCAREGRSVFVAESFSAFGGAAVSMLVPAFMTFSNGVVFLEAVECLFGYFVVYLSAYTAGEEINSV